MIGLLIFLYFIIGFFCAAIIGGIILGQGPSFKLFMTFILFWPFIIVVWLVKVVVRFRPRNVLPEYYSYVKDLVTKL